MTKLYEDALNMLCARAMLFRQINYLRPKSVVVVMIISECESGIVLKVYSTVVQKANLVVVYISCQSEV